MLRDNPLDPTTTVIDVKLDNATLETLLPALALPESVALQPWFTAAAGRGVPLVAVADQAVTLYFDAALAAAASTRVLATSAASRAHPL